MRNFIVSDDLTAPLIDGYQQVKTNSQLLQFNGLKLLVQGERVLIFGDIGAVDTAWLSRLPAMAEPELFQNLYQICGAFLLIFHHLDTNETKVVADRNGHYKLFYAAREHGFLLSDDLTQFDTDHVSRTALSEYFHYRWNNTKFSYFEDIQQIFYGDYVIIYENEITRRVKYNAIFWGDSFVTKAPRSDLKALLLAALDKNINRQLPTYVLLSGGVDSAILLALTKELVPDLIAITPNHHQHANPELERAINFARAVDVPHQILDIDDTEIRQLFEDTTVCMQQVPRNQSSLTMYSTLSSIPSPANIIYGEAADILFGSTAAKNFKARLAKIKKKDKLPALLQRVLIKLLPESHKFSLLLKDEILNSLLGNNKIDNPADFEQCLSVSDFNLVRQDFFRRYSLSKVELENLSDKQLIALFKQWLMDTAVYNHMYETGQIAAQFEHTLVTPFLDASLINYALQLSGDEYFGSSHVKPLLRELGAQYYHREWMYLPKLGFPVPHESWLANELKDLVAEARDNFGVQSLPVDIELSWTLAGLYVLKSKLQLPLNGLQ